MIYENDLEVVDGEVKKYKGPGGKITVPESVTSVADYAFFGRSGTIKYNVYKEGKYIGSEGNPYHILFSVKKASVFGKIHPETRVIMYRAFKGCYNLIEATIPDGVVSIGAHAFEGCENLDLAVIPESVEMIYGSAFCGCTSLTSVKLPENLRSIGTYAFRRCKGLKSITVPKSVTNIKVSAFSYCPGIDSIKVDPENPVYHSDGNCLIDTKEKTLLLGCKNSIIPDDGSVTSIDYDAFDGCTELTTLTIPKYVTSINSTAFSHCSGLSEIIVDSGNPVYHSDGNCLIDTNEKTLLFGCKNSVIPDDGSVTKIGMCAFTGCTALKSIIIPDGVLSIGRYAFSDCASLNSALVPDSAYDIDDFSFNRCPKLTMRGLETAYEYARKHGIRFKFNFNNI